MIQNILLGCGALMTVGLLFFFRSLVRQIRKEAAEESKKQDTLG
jgi:hypothetical protein